MPADRAQARCHWWSNGWSGSFFPLQGPLSGRQFLPLRGDAELRTLPDENNRSGTDIAALTLPPHGRKWGGNEMATTKCSDVCRAEMRKSGTMLGRWSCLAAAVMAVASVATAAEPGVVPVPSAVRALEGCWYGTGHVMGKSVTITLSAKPIVQDALFVIDVTSAATDDASDLYSAHLILGGANQPPRTLAEPISGFWADSFGGGFTATGQGSSRPDGFDVTYAYPDTAFLNHWRIQGDNLAWEIVARDDDGHDTPFALYSLAKASCPAAPPSVSSQ